MEGETSSIYSLPDEVVLMILKRTSYADCNSFMRTCKLYNDLLKSSHSLWRVIYRKTVGNVIFNTTASQSNVNWLCVLRQYLNLRDLLINLIVDMSPKHFSECNKYIVLDNVKEIFAVALSNSTNYFCTVTILQDFIQTALKKVNTFETKKPYTLTEIHYGKMVVRYLIHIAFTLKWVQYHNTNQLSPEIVLNFFNQWLDPLEMHSDEEVRDLIKDMVKEVDRALIETSDNGRVPGVETENTCSNGIYTEKDVLLAISNYMYKQKRMVLKSACNQHTLDIVKTIKSNSGHGACLGAIFEAIARGFGIKNCILVAFPNHLYLEWQSNKGFRNETMRISLDKGELLPSGRCPFAANMNPVDRVNYKYSADSFIQYIISNFLGHMGDYTGWHTDNAVHLLVFITNNRNSEYCDFILYLRDPKRQAMSLPFNIENIHVEHINYIHGLLALNIQPEPQRKNLDVKHRRGALKYSVGLICYHRIYEYVCVIRDWELECPPEFKIRHPEADALKFGTGQPFYYITAADKSDRYVAQENLILVTNPTRIYHLEDAIAKEFSHFNGFFYEPNSEQQLLYPEDMAIGNMYASKFKNNMIPDNVQRH